MTRRDAVQRRDLFATNRFVRQNQHSVLKPFTLWIERKSPTTKSVATNTNVVSLIEFQWHVVDERTDKPLSLYPHQKGPPPNNCIATVGGKKILKKVDEAWPTDDVCVKAVCAFDTNGNPIIKAQREACNAICQAVSLSFDDETTNQSFINFPFIVYPCRATSYSHCRTNVAVSALKRNASSITSFTRLATNGRVMISAQHSPATSRMVKRSFHR